MDILSVRSVPDKCGVILRSNQNNTCTCRVKYAVKCPNEEPKFCCGKHISSVEREYTTRRIQDCVNYVRIGRNGLTFKKINPVPQPIQRLVPQPVQRPVPQPIQRPVPQPVQRPAPQLIEQVEEGLEYRSRSSYTEDELNEMNEINRQINSQYQQRREEIGRIEREFNQRIRDVYTTHQENIEELGIKIKKLMIVKISLKFDDESEETDCSICREEVTQETGGHLKCGHVYHNNCINEWRSRNNTCPLCRSVIKTE